MLTSSRRSFIDDNWKRCTSRPRDWMRDDFHPQAWQSKRPRTEVETAPPGFPEIEERLVAARGQLPAQDNWDDEGAIAISADTFHMATRFLLKTARAVRVRSGITLPAPKIGPCADGSIDLYWRTDKFTLLINLQPEDNAESDFYGETPNGLKLKGTFRPSQQDFALIHWLAEQ